MDLLIEHKDNIVFELKRVILRSIEDKETVLVGEQVLFMSNMVSAIKVEKMLGKRCKTYLEFVMGSQDNLIRVHYICTVKDFPNVFPDKLLGLPPDREMEIAIELYPGSSLVSITSYHMPPKELKELKVQLQELRDRGFIRPSILL